MTDNISAVAIVAEVLPTDIDGTAFLGLDEGAFSWGDPAGVAQQVVDALRAAGRLLPDGGETRTEWEVRWHSGPDDGICMEERYHASRASAETVGPTRIGQYGITRYSIHRREHRIFEDGSSWSGPWVEVTDG